jgi:hypothetical protein
MSFLYGEQQMKVTKREEIENFLTFTGICEYQNKDKFWIVSGRCHRTDGPAYEGSDGSKSWFVNGELHRLDGPACEYPNGNKYWYINNKEYSEEEFNKHPLVVKHKQNKITKCENIEDFSKFTGICEFEDGSKSWYVNGKQHKTDGPAIEWKCGTKEWYLNGNLHRLEGPAVEFADGTKHWYVNGKLHRADGPACEYSDGRKCWWIDATRHRLDGPAVDYPNGSREYPDGKKDWFIHDKQYSEEEFNKHPLVVAYKQTTQQQAQEIIDSCKKAIQSARNEIKEDLKEYCEAICILQEEELFGVVDCASEKYMMELINVVLDRLSNCIVPQFFGTDHYFFQEHSDHITATLEYSADGQVKVSYTLNLFTRKCHSNQKPEPIAESEHTIEASCFNPYGYIC